MTVITMSRQIGSRGEEIADKLCTELGLRVFDKNLMMRVAHEVGLTETQIVDYSEERYELRSFLDALFRRTRTVAQLSTKVRTNTGKDTVDTLVLNEPRAIDLIRATMLAAYKHDNVLIIGRGGQAILEDKPDVLLVRVVAPIEMRIERVREHEQCTPIQARRLVEERDCASQEYLRTFHHIDVDDPTIYHLVLNSDRLGVDKCVELIKSVAEGIKTAKAG
jgi:cytidylate kinase